MLGASCLPDKVVNERLTRKTYVHESVYSDNFCHELKYSCDPLSAGMRPAFSLPSRRVAPNTEQMTSLALPSRHAANSPVCASAWAGLFLGFRHG